MRNLSLAIAAAAMAIPMALPTAGPMSSPVISSGISGVAQARDRYYRGKTWRDSRGRLRCKRPNGTTGLIIGAAGGALAGRAIDTRGERTTGTVLGAAAGALLGRQVERGSGRRCR